jgi:digeranylgeranylglycerophospholipid reductase
VIPTGEDTARVGLACRSGSPYEALRRIVRERLGDPKVLGVRAGRVLTCGPVSKSFARGFMAVGDAAGQAKPTTGGGVATGGICARIAGRVAAEAVARNDTSEGVMRSYDSEWRTVLGREFAAMSRARRIFDRLTDGTVDRLFRVVLEEELYREAEDAGDIDFQGLVLRRLARNPKVVAVLPSVLKDLVFR